MKMTDYQVKAIRAWVDGIPFDEYGYALMNNDLYDDNKKPTLNNPTIAIQATNPYGILEYAVGSDDDFVCFDYHVFDNGKVALHAVLNSETGCFIQDFEYVITDKENALEAALQMVEGAINWCYENRIKHKRKNWNQCPYYFYNSVAKELGIKQFKDDKELRFTVAV